MARTIPNIIHFIYPCHSTRPLSFLNYMAVKLAKEVHRPDAILFWIDGDPAPSPWWDEIQHLVEIRIYNTIKEYGGTKIMWPQYASDVFRLQLLRDYGGIYLDTDMLLVQPITDFIENSWNQLLMSYEPTQNPEPESICNALIIAAPQNEFITAWLDRMPDALKSETWAHGGVQIPYLLHKEQPDLGAHEIRGASMFCPLDLSKNWLFSTDPQIIREAEDITRFSYAIHGFETYWRDIVKDITPEWCTQNDSLFSRIVRAHQ
jgi:hypothetical protein